MLQNGHVQCPVPETVSFKVTCSVRHRACSRHERRYSTVASVVSLGQNWRAHGTRKEFLGTRHSLFCQFSILFLPDQRLYVVKNKCIYTQISDRVQTIHELPLLPNNTAVKCFYTNWSDAKC